MNARQSRIRLKLNESGEALATVYAAITPDRWETPVYADGEAWNARQVFVHLADAQRGIFANAQRMARGEGSSIPEGFDLERYNGRVKKKMDEMTAADAFASVNETRAAVLAWLETLDDAQLDIEGRHATGEVMPLGKLLRLMALHELAHASDVARALGLSVKPPTSGAAPDA